MTYPKFRAVSKTMRRPKKLSSMLGPKTEYKLVQTFHVSVQFDRNCTSFVSNHQYKDMSAAVSAAKRRQEKYSGMLT